MPQRPAPIWYDMVWYDMVRYERLTFERAWSTDVTRTNFRYADLADVPGFDEERTTRQRTVKVRHLYLIVSYKIQLAHINLLPFISMAGGEPMKSKHTI